MLCATLGRNIFIQMQVSMNFCIRVFVTIRRLMLLLGYLGAVYMWHGFGATGNQVQDLSVDL